MSLSPHSSHLPEVFLRRPDLAKLVAGREPSPGPVQTVRRSPAWRSLPPDCTDCTDCTQHHARTDCDLGGRLWALWAFFSFVMIRCCESSEQFQTAFFQQSYMPVTQGVCRLPAVCQDLRRFRCFITGSLPSSAPASSLLQEQGQVGCMFCFELDEKDFIGQSYWSTTV